MQSVLVQALIYLAAAMIAVPLARRLGLGSVLGYLIAGVAIGPVLHLVGSETVTVQAFAEFGVVLMLFLIGLELEARALWAMRGRLLGLGGLQVGLTTALVAAAAMAAGAAWNAALAAGMILCLSSTAIVMQTLEEKRLVATEGGQASFAVLLFQDMAALPFLALIPLLALGGAPHAAVAEEPIHLLPDWTHPFVIAAAVGLVILGGRYLVRPAFAYFSLARMREVEVAAALLIVIAVSVIMDAIGLSPALGSFLAGVVLAGSEYRHALRSDIAPFKGLLMGLFFITVGASIDLRMIAAEPLRILGLVLALIVAKMLVLYLLARLFRLQGRDRMLFTFALAQAGEFGFFLAAFAGQSGVMTPAETSTVLIVVSLSMFLTPVLFIIQEKLGRGPGAPPEAADAIDAQGPVIVAGYGRFGRTVDRMLRAAGHATVVIDADRATVSRMRAVGFRAYYGDVERPDLLEAAGIAQARALVIAIDDRAKSLALARFLRREHPQVRIVARARDVQHALEFADLGVDETVREVFDGALRAGRRTLEALGHAEPEIEQLARALRVHDRELSAALAAIWDRRTPLESSAAYGAKLRELDQQVEALCRRGASEDGTPPGPSAAQPAVATQHDAP